MKIVNSFGTIYEYTSNCSILLNIHKCNINFEDIHFNEYRAIKKKTMERNETTIQKSKYTKIDHIMCKKNLGDVLTLLVRNAKNDNVFRYYLITKMFKHNHTSSVFLKIALVNLKKIMLVNKTNKIIVPTFLFECDDDYIWNYFKCSITEIFADTDVEIVFLYKYF